MNGAMLQQAFAKKYHRFAEEFQDVLFLEIVGDENRDTRVCNVTSHIS